MPQRFLLIIAFQTLILLPPSQLTAEAAVVQQPQRPPAVEILRTVESPGGHGRELHRLTVSGTARNAEGAPVKNATIFLANSSKKVSEVYIPRNFNLLRGQVKTDENGHYELQDIQLLVNRNKHQPGPINGKFVLFGTSPDYGFTWHRTCRYIPIERPEKRTPIDPSEGGALKVFYQNEPIILDLTFDRPAQLKGRISDKQGRPLAHTRISLGHGNLYSSGRGGPWNCQFLGNHNQPLSQPLSFVAIEQLPRELRETYTDTHGNYEFTNLRRDTIYLAEVDPGPAFDIQRFTVGTASKKLTRGRCNFSVGYDGILNQELESPRSTTIQVHQADTGLPLNHVLVSAQPGNVTRRAGFQARSDSEGNARLQLLPGQYQLIAEPTPDQPFCFFNESFSVSDQSEEAHHRIKLRQAAVVILRAVNAETGEPLPGIRFNQQKQDSEKVYPVSTQTVYLDYPKTNSAGEIQAFLEPGTYWFTVADPFTSKSSIVKLPVPGNPVKLTAGEATTVEFPLSPAQIRVLLPLTAPFRPERVSSLPAIVQEHKHRQEQILQQSNLQVMVRELFFNWKNIDSQGLLQDLHSLPPEDVPEIINLMEKYHGEKLSQRKYSLLTNGVIHRESIFNTAPMQKEAKTLPGQPVTPTTIHLYDGRFLLGYNLGNSARVSQSRIAFVRTVSSLCDWTSLTQRQTIVEKSGISTHQRGRQSVCEMETGEFFSRLIFDSDSGFLYSNHHHDKRRGTQTTTLFFAPAKLENGLILPRLSITIQLIRERLITLRIFQLDQVRLHPRFPVDAFSISLPAGTHILDSRHIPAGSSRYGQLRPVQFTERNPITDFAAYLQRHPHLKPPASPEKTDQ